MILKKTKRKYDVEADPNILVVMPLWFPNKY